MREGKATRVHVDGFGPDAFATHDLTVRDRVGRRKFQRVRDDRSMPSTPPELVLLLES